MTDILSYLLIPYNYLRAKAKELSKFSGQID